MTSILKALVIGSRPKTLTASISPVLLGFSLSYTRLNTLPDLSIAFPILLAAILIQILTNYVNDLYDFRKGKDTTKRIGPKRVLQSGMISDRAMTKAIYFITILILILGWYIVTKGGIPILIIGVLSILGAYCYTAGPYPLAYNGLGEIFVFIFFGPIAVCGTEYMLTGDYSQLGLYFGFMLGGIASALLVVNNTRDLEEDRSTNKKTLVSIYGRTFANSLFAICLIFPLLITNLKFIKNWQLVVFTSVTAIIFFNLSLKFNSLQTGIEFNKMLTCIGKTLLIFSLVASAMFLNF